jgi:hypothetical protein
VCVRKASTIVFEENATKDVTISDVSKGVSVINAYKDVPAKIVCKDLVVGKHCIYACV